MTKIAKALIDHRELLPKKGFPFQESLDLLGPSMERADFSFGTNGSFRNQNRLIAIEGVLGVGKTSLARLLSSRWNVPCFFEVFEENPFLTGGFYENKSLAFNTEAFFLLSRFRQQREVALAQGLHLIDYFFDKNLIFAKSNLKDKDLELYQEVYQRLKPEVRKPDLVIYLQADLETHLRRIYFRDRKFERSISPRYVESLIHSYHSFFTQYDEAPVLAIDTNRLDYVSNSNDLNRVIHLIEERLSGQVQLSLLQANRAQEARI